VDRARDKLFQQRGELWGRLQFFADHVVAAVHSPDESTGSVFGISAPWGSGKSSALGIILDLMYERLEREIPKLSRDPRQRGFLVDDEYVLTTSTFRANLHVSSPLPPRLSLAYEVLQGFPESYLHQLMEHLGYERKERGLDAPIQAEMFLRTKLQEYGTAGPVVERWILDSFLQHRGERRAARPAGAPDSRTHVHVQLIDDLDRCAESYAAEVLAALSFWAALPNLYFVVAADEAHLKRSARAATDLHEAYDGEALEKFVHFQLRIPPLIAGYADAAGYALQLFPDGPALPPGVEHFRSLLSEVTPGDPFGLLAPALAARTPRQAKRVFNELLQEFWVLVDREGDSVKRIVARLAWPDAFDTYISPALVTPDESSLLRQVGSPRAEWLRMVIQLGAAVLGEQPRDPAAAARRLAERAGERGIDLHDCPADLILYVSAEPQVVPAGAGGLDADRVGRSRTTQAAVASPSALIPPASKSRDADELEKLVTDAQIADGLQDTVKLTGLCKRIVQLAAGGLGDEDTAPRVGNLALRIERRDPQLALAMHQVAVHLDPAHANIRLNLASFLIDVGAREVEPAAREHLDWLAEHEPEFKPMLQRVLRARLALLGGERPEGIGELVDDALGAGSKDGSWRELIRLLRRLEDADALERVSRTWFEQLYGEEDRTAASEVLDTLAEGLVMMSDDDAISRGADIMRLLVARGFLPSSQYPAVRIGNLAILYANRRYGAAAGALYRIAYERLPQLSSIRAAYARHLLNQGDPQNAYAVQQGQEVRIPVPDEAALRAALAEVPPRFDQEPQWWAEYDLPALVEPIHALAP
jgi:hypothetical protein